MNWLAWDSSTAEEEEEEDDAAAAAAEVAGVADLSGAAAAVAFASVAGGVGRM